MPARSVDDSSCPRRRRKGGRVFSLQNSLPLSTLLFVILLLVLPPHTVSQDNVRGAKARMLTVTDDIAARFGTAKDALMESLQKDYGPYVPKLFFDEAGQPRLIFQGGSTPPPEVETEGAEEALDDVMGVDMMRLKRRILIKLLRTLVVASATTDANAAVPVSNQFVWATGGHSATAGHGNFFAESYTAELERRLQPIFSAVGLDFVGRNYAMGGTSSGAEVGFCVDQIFGQDIDVLVWDYGMTDGKDTTLMETYFYRAQINPNRPIGIAYHVGGRTYGWRRAVMQRLGDIGVPSLISDEPMLDAIMQEVPDNLGMGEEEIAQLAPLVQSFKCDGMIEKGEPHCGDRKWNTTDCMWRKFRTSWHPGYKWHALMGNLAAMYVVKVLEGAVQDLQALPPEEWARKLAELEGSEQADHLAFMDAEIPEHLVNMFTNLPGLDPRIILKEPSMCHTARLPAEIRHKGILTETPDKVGFWDYDPGIPQRVQNEDLNTDGVMRLTQEDGSRQVCDFAPVSMDFKDYFYIHGKSGWQTLVLPNDSELAEYNTATADNRLHGHVAVCLTMCPWGKCPAGHLQASAFAEGTAVLEVNGIVATEVTPIKGDCAFAKHDGGYTFPKNASGRFEIRARAVDENSFLRISAFILW